MNPVAYLRDGLKEKDKETKVALGHHRGQSWGSWGGAGGQRGWQSPIPPGGFLECRQRVSHCSGASVLAGLSSESGIGVTTLGSVRVRRSTPVHSSTVRDHHVVVGLNRRGSIPVLWGSTGPSIGPSF